MFHLVPDARQTPAFRLTQNERGGYSASCHRHPSHSVTTCSAKADARDGQAFPGAATSVDRGPGSSVGPAAVDHKCCGSWNPAPNHRAAADADALPGARTRRSPTARGTLTLGFLRRRLRESANPLILASGELYWVSAAMTKLACHAARPPAGLGRAPHDLPSPSGPSSSAGSVALADRAAGRLER